MQRPNDGTVFERGDRVLDYWLVHSEGFAVARGSVKQRVVGAVVDPRDGRARSVLVRTGARGRTRSVPAAAVAAVDPFEKVLYLERRHLPRPRPVHVTPALSRLRFVLAAAASVAASALRAAAVHGRGGGAALRRGVEWSAPRARTHAGALAAGGERRARAAAVWCRPRAVACARKSRAAAYRTAVVCVRGCRLLSAVAARQARRLERVAASVRDRRALRTDRPARKVVP